MICIDLDKHGAHQDGVQAFNTLWSEHANEPVKISIQLNELHGLVDKELTLEEYQEYLTVLRSYQPKTRKELLHILKVRGKLKREFSKNIKRNEKDGYYATYPPILPAKNYRNFV